MYIATVKCYLIDFYSFSFDNLIYATYIIKTFVKKLLEQICTTSMHNTLTCTFLQDRETGGPLPPRQWTEPW